MGPFFKRDIHQRYLLNKTNVVQPSHIGDLRVQPYTQPLLPYQLESGKNTDIKTSMPLHGKLAT